MKLIPIPDELLPAEHCERVTLGAPRGYEEEVYPAEVIRDNRGLLPIIRMLVQIDAEELVEIESQKGQFWISIWGSTMPPIAFNPNIFAYLDGE